MTHHLNIISAYSTLTSLLAVAGQDSCAQAAAARVEDVPLQWAELQDCMWQNVDASCAPGGEQQNEQKPSQFRHHEKWAISEPFRMHELTFCIRRRQHVDDDFVLKASITRS